MGNDGYNGYTNYQTWVVSLWLSNDYGSYTYYTERAQELLDEHDGDRDDAIYCLAQEVEADHDERNPTQDSSVFSDLLGHALQSVDWQETVQSFFES